MSGKPIDNVGILDEARQINSSLRRVGQHVRVSVTLAGNATETLDQDGTTIQKALNEHKYELKNALSSTSRRLTRIKNAAIYEKYYLFAAIGFFMAVIAYIVMKRLGVLGTAWYFIQCKMLSK